MEADDLRVQMARLEEHMKTMQAEYKTDIALLAERLADRDARLEKEMADGRAEAARRETSLVTRLTVMVGVAVAILSVVGAFLAFANRILPSP